MSKLWRWILGDLDATTLLLPNIVSLCLMGLFLLGTALSGTRRVERLVTADDATTRRIHELERAVTLGGPQASWAALELARLYRRAGAFPWSYEALRQAESHGPREPAYRLELGLAYVELGRNADGERVIKGALAGCVSPGCTSAVRARLALFERVATLMREREIDARYEIVRADEVFREVLKPAESTGLGPRTKGDTRLGAGHGDK